MEVVVSSVEAKPDLITLDLLGGCSSKDLDLGPSSSAFSCHADLHLLDLNLLPQDGGKSAAAAAAVPQPLAASQSVCTIEKVKWALERAAERESRGTRAAATGDGAEQQPSQQKRLKRGREPADGSISPSPSSSSSITTASVKRLRTDGGAEEGTTSDGCDSAAAAGGSLVAAGCPSCLSYVLISKNNPRCPRCEAEVPPPATTGAPLQKKPRIDLNFALDPL